MFTNIFIINFSDMISENINILPLDDNLPRKVSILGVTGSIGKSTADLILSKPEAFDIQAVTANNNVKDLAELAIKLDASMAVIANDDYYEELKSALVNTDIKIAAGKKALIEAASYQADWIMGAIVGMAGLESLIEAIKQGSNVAIANKEPLVSAGPIILSTARKYGANLLPVDSEHNAIFQVFDNDNRNGIERIIITASGGPFRTWSMEEMRNATPEQAVAHPNWSMGAKISVDSATLMNKSLEVIEAHYLFDMPGDKIDVVIHPQSIIHSMVEYSDGSILAQMGAADMRTPIAHTLSWPERMDTSGQRLDLLSMGSLDFEKPDYKRFPSLKMAYECLNNCQHACLLFNAANEVAVDAFLNGKIGFSGIYDLIKKTMDESEMVDISSLEHVITLDQSGRKLAKSFI
jgi:1-deoxy-D-xylulose-5-phosphate reductoisomerase